jgi:ribosomal protein L11 methyltransferase
MDPEDRTWTLVTMRIGRDAEEIAVSFLFDLGATGAITLDEKPETLEIGAYFQSGLPPETIVSELKTRLEQANLLGCLRETAFTRIRDEDWLRKWKEGFEATEIADRLLIAPSWKVNELRTSDSGPRPGVSEGRDLASGPGYVGGRVLVQIDPGMAFGTGTHETTRLCLEAIERNWKGGKFLDVGTGTGILAIAAGLLVPGSDVIAIDVDPVAVEIARQNLAINHLTGVELSEGPLGLYGSGDFNVVVANLTAGVIMDILGQLTELLAPFGCLILSGILKEQAPDVALALDRKGFVNLERTDAGEWACLIARCQ